MRAGRRSGPNFVALSMSSTDNATKNGSSAVCGLESTSTVVSRPQTPRWTAQAGRDHRVLRASLFFPEAQQHARYDVPMCAPSKNESDRQQAADGGGDVVAVGEPGLLE